MIAHGPWFRSEACGTMFENRNVNALSSVADVRSNERARWPRSMPKPAMAPAPV